MLIPFTSASFTNLSGLAVADGAEVEVRLELNGALAALFDDRDGTTPLTNPFNADSQGRFEFYVAGRIDGYSIQVTKGAQTHTLRHQLTGSAAATLFDNTGTGLLAESVQDALVEISVLGQFFRLVTDDMTSAQRADVFGNVGSLDTLADIEIAVTDAVANRKTLIFTAGTYAISDVLELGYDGLKVIALGKVIIKHTGIGKAISFDGGAVSGEVNGIHFGWGNPFHVHGNANTTDLVYLRSSHRMRMGVNARDGATSFNFNFSVLSQFDLTSSVNEGAFSTRPTNGLITNQRNSGESSSDCQFYLTIEGMADWGVDLQFCNASTFFGSSEGNLAGGLNLRATCFNNTFINFDNEANGSTNPDWAIAGDRNTFIGCISAITTAAPATSITGKRNKFSGGEFSSMTIAAGADYNTLDGLGINGDLAINSNLTTTIINCVDNTGTPITQMLHRLPTLFDDFLGTQLNSLLWNTRVGTDAACNVSADLSLVGGVVRLVTGADAAGSLAANGAMLDQGVLQWRPFQDLSMEFRVIIFDITSVAIFIGLTDQISIAEMPIYSAASADTITTDAADAVGVLFDTAMATDNWWLVGVANNVDATAQNAGFAPTAAIYETWRIDINNAGAATFYRNGIKVGTQMIGAVTANAPLSPVAVAFSRSGSLRIIDIDYIRCQGKQS